MLYHRRLSSGTGRLGVVCLAAILLMACGLLDGRGARADNLPPPPVATYWTAPDDPPGQAKSWHINPNWSQGVPTGTSDAHIPLPEPWQPPLAKVSVSGAAYARDLYVQGELLCTGGSMWVRSLHMSDGQLTSSVLWTFTDGLYFTGGQAHFNMVRANLGTTLDVAGGEVTIMALDLRPGALPSISSGSLDVYGLVVGDSGAVTFTQTGGDVTARGVGLILGKMNGSNGVYEMTGGRLDVTAGSLTIGRYGNGTITMSDAELTATTVIASRRGTISADANSSIALIENLEIGLTDAGRFDLAEATVRFNGSGGVVQTLEAASPSAYSSKTTLSASERVARRACPRRSFFRAACQHSRRWHR